MLLIAPRKSDGMMELDKGDISVNRLVYELKKQNRGISKPVAEKLNALVAQGATYEDISRLYSFGDPNVTDIDYILRMMKAKSLEDIIEEFAQRSNANLQKSTAKSLESTVEDTTLLAKEICAQIKVTQNLLTTVKDTYDIRKEKEILDLEAKIKQKEDIIEILQKKNEDLTDEIKSLKEKIEKKPIEEIVFLSSEEVQNQNKKDFFFFWKNRKKGRQKEVEDLISIITNPNMTDEVAQELKMAFVDGLVIADIKRLAGETNIKKLRKNRTFITGLRGLHTSVSCPREEIHTERGGDCTYEAEEEMINNEGLGDTPFFYDEEDEDTEGTL